jgi:hypothetical protein
VWTWAVRSRMPGSKSSLLFLTSYFFLTMKAPVAFLIFSADLSYA